MIDLHNADCMDYMKTQPDNAFDLAVVDPPYGIKASSMNMGKGKNKKYKTGKTWDNNTPDNQYFTELFRISKHQIIFGGNYFDLPATGGWIFWDKDRRKKTSFSDGELAWTSFLNVVRKIIVRYDGFIGSDGDKIHPTQKPIKLYELILANYAATDARILDTHLGSGSSAIAAHYAGLDFVGIELDPDYFKAAQQRIKNKTAQLALFATN